MVTSERLQPVTLLSAMVALLAGCGGGGGSTPPPPPPPGVSSVTVSNAKYGQQATFTVAGTALDTLSVSVASPACRVAPAATGTATSTQATFACVLGTPGATSVTVSTGTTVALTQAYTVPQPQVTLTLGGGATGNIVIALEPEKTPITVNNFLAYVNSGFYVGTLIHRLAPGFVIQGGGYTSVRPTIALKQANAPIALEVNQGLSNVQWSVAMARGTSADSATSEFFINLVDNSGSLDPSGTTAGFAVFGHVAAGTSVVTAAAGAACSAVANFFPCVPNTDIVVTAASQSQ